MQVMTDTALRQMREGIGATREALARKTRDLSLSTIRNAERGQRVTMDTATQLLEAINALLAEKGEPPVSLDDLGLTLY